MKILALALALVLGLIPAFATPAFAVTSVFQIDVADSDPNKNYNVCVVTQGYEALPTDCMNFKGSEFKSYFAEFSFEDMLIGDPFYTSVEDLSTNQFVYKNFENTNENPQVIDVSMANPGPKQSQATEYDVETQTQTDETGTTTWTDPKTGLVYDIPTQGDYCLDFDEDSVCDIDFTDGKQVVYDTETETQVEDAVGESGKGNGNGNGDSDANPYCDKLNDEQKSNTVCHDRRDVDSETGIATCNDGTHKKDWRDCKDASGYDYNDNNDEESSDEEDTGGSNPDGEEEDQSCGGESCTDDEKEDSTTDEDNLYGD